MSENNNLKTCSRCHSTKLESYFGINAKDECYKSCDKCRKKRRDIKEELKPKPNPEEIKSTYLSAKQRFDALVVINPALDSLRKRFNLQIDF
jgi:superfamily II DNA helicase RecQ